MEMSIDEFGMLMDRIAGTANSSLMIVVWFTLNRVLRRLDKLEGK